MTKNKEHEFCLRCGRRLKNPIARERGYGTVCQKKIRAEKSHQLFNTGGNKKQEPS